jgi:hypothetical protein
MTRISSSWIGSFHGYPRLHGDLDDGKEGVTAIWMTERSVRTVESDEEAFHFELLDWIAFLSLRVVQSDPIASRTWGAHRSLSRVVSPTRYIFYCFPVRI